jgi:hypothetical protein
MCVLPGGFIATSYVGSDSYESTIAGLFADWNEVLARGRGVKNMRQLRRRGARAGEILRKRKDSERKRLSYGEASEHRTLRCVRRHTLGFSLQQ